MDAPAPYLVMTTTVLQFKSSLAVSIALMSCEIWSSCSNILATREKVRQIHTAGLSCCSSGMFFFAPLILFCISKQLTLKGRTSLDQWKLCRAGGIYLHSHSFSLFYMYFEVLRWVISEGGQQQCLTDECFFNISCAHQKKNPKVWVCLCVRVLMCVLKEEADLQGVLEEWVWLNQAAITARLLRNRVREQERRRGEMKRRQQNFSVLRESLHGVPTGAQITQQIGRQYAYNPYYNEIKHSALGSRWLQA